ncbi:MAG TPA: hypothetical protein VFV72_09160 [Candidatus Limnocylindrales bacterium]|nr:hypothetical protein [Candidatus Limnocylindrales bacterium]
MDPLNVLVAGLALAAIVVLAFGAATASSRPEVNKLIEQRRVLNKVSHVSMSTISKVALAAGLALAAVYFLLTSVTLRA